jgi:hypothetical protein
MSFSSEASVIYHNEHDYWRTWFFEECEKEGLFGITEKHLQLLTANKSEGGYYLGIEIFLEDAPYFKATRTHHLVCGPYRVIESTLPDGGSPVHQIGGKLIVYKVKYPENGPWFDRSEVTRTIKGQKISFSQRASEFNFFPYRFSIQKAKNYHQKLVEHNETGCWLCKHARKRRNF